LHFAAEEVAEIVQYRLHNGAYCTLHSYSIPGKNLAGLGSPMTAGDQVAHRIASLNPHSFAALYVCPIGVNTGDEWGGAPCGV